MNASEIQKNAVKKRWLKEEESFPLPVISNDKLYHPFNYACELIPGYFYIPWINGRVVVNRDGELFSVRYNRKQKTNITPKGYLTTTVRIGELYRAIPVHRIVAMLFCEIPERHKDKNFDELEVNHIDGNKTNNRYSNLEWVTTNENMKHAWNSGFIKTKIPVLTLHVRTLKVKRFDGISECARFFGVTPGELSIHLKSISVGRVEYKEHRFKYDDGKPWPDLYTLLGEDSDLALRHDVIGFNVVTKQMILFSSLVHAATILNFNVNSIRMHRTRKGFNEPYKNWVFKTLSGLPMSNKLKGSYAIIPK